MIVLMFLFALFHDKVIRKVDIVEFGYSLCILPVPPLYRRLVKLGLAKIRVTLVKVRVVWVKVSVAMVEVGMA